MTVINASLLVTLILSGLEGETLMQQGGVHLIPSCPNDPET